jgi:hypothetical protein
MTGHQIDRKTSMMKIYKIPRRPLAAWQALCCTYGYWLQTRLLVAAACPGYYQK